MSIETPQKFSITKKTLDSLLFRLSKIYKKLGGRKAVSQIVLVGGASVLAAYHFRESTTDIDAFGNILKEAIIKMADEYNLPYEWLNKDFMFSESYTPKLYDYSTYYKTFNQVFEVRIVKREYLIAMKLNSSRTYKKDLSDIIGILKEEREIGNPISLNEIKIAYSNLYGSYDKLSLEVKDFIETQINRTDHDEQYKLISNFELSKHKELENDINEIVKHKVVVRKVFTDEKKKSGINELLKIIKKQK